jgi:hypothetical protein
MGAVESTPEPAPPEPTPAPVTIRLPYPGDNRKDEILLPDTLNCSTCELTVKSNISTATVQLARFVGPISEEECDQYKKDYDLVLGKQLSLFEFASRLHQGFYSTREGVEPGYCQELGLSDQRLQDIATGSSWDTSWAIRKQIRPVSAHGSFSANSKATIELGAPFELVLSGRAARYGTSEGFTNPPVRERFLPLIIYYAIANSASARARKAEEANEAELRRQAIRRAERDDAISSLTYADAPFTTSIPSQEGAGEAYNILQKPVKVTRLSLYYPSPIRLNGIQHDAVLALNDPSYSKEEDSVVILIPLKASTTGDEPSAAFLRQVARYIPAVRDIDPMTGLYPTVTVQTGSTWNISSLFNLDVPSNIPGEPEVDPNTRFAVNNGYYIWKGYTEFESITQERTMQNFPEQSIIWQGWKPKSPDLAPVYVMLDAPVAIDSTDLITLTRSLPPTPPEKAIHVIPKNEKWIYHKRGNPPPAGMGNVPGDEVSACSTNLCAAPETEDYVNYNSAVDLDRAKTQFDILQKSLEGDYSTTKFAKDLENCPGAKCDIFLQNLKRLELPDSRVVFRVIYSVLFILALFVGIYFAVAAASRGYDTKITSIGEIFGKLAGIAARRWQESFSSSASTAPAGPGLLDRLTSMAQPPSGPSSVLPAKPSLLSRASSLLRRKTPVA